MADSPTTPTRAAASSKSGWTDAEKVAFLMHIVQTHTEGSIQWKKLTPPPGRTIKACMHLLEKMKKEANATGLYAQDAESTPNGETGTTPVGTPSKAGRKRKNTGDTPETPAPKKGRKGKKDKVEAHVKAESDGDGDGAEPAVKTEEGE